MSLLPGARKFDPNAVPPVPEGYSVGLGRGARSFTTRADLGVAPVVPGAGRGDGGGRGGGSGPWGAPPAGYVPGRGRGATGFAGGVSRDDTVDHDKADYSDANYDEFSGYAESLFKDAEYDDEDRQADEIYEDIDRTMDFRRKSRREQKLKEELAKLRAEKPTIQAQFADLKRNLGNVSREEWEAIPDSGDTSIKNKQKKPQQLMPAPDYLLHGAQLSGRSTGTVQRSGLATPMMGSQTPIGGLSTPMGLQTPMGLRTPLGLSTPLGGLSTPLGLRTPMGSASSSLNDLGEAREKVLSVKLDKVMDSVSGQTVMDPKGYLTDLNSMQLKSDADIADIKKARLLLKSVITTNPKHPPGWIAATRLEELAGKIIAARELIAQGCKHCPNSEDVWLEAARLEKPANAKAVLAKAVKQMPHSVRLWLDAMNRETEKEMKATVLRKALEFIPNSVRLWKEAVSLEDEGNARILLSRAVECVPQAVEMWLALARLSTYKEAQKVLNQARLKVPTSPVIWVSAAKLEETQNNVSKVDVIINRALESLANKFHVTLERETWLKLAEEAEKSGHVNTCRAIVKATMEVGVEDVNMKNIWKEDAQGCIARGSIETARALYNNALDILKTKKSLWMALADLETKHGTAESLDAVLQRAVSFCPKEEVLWLMAAKQKWLQGDVPAARQILAEAYSQSGNSEAISLAAVKLERENNEVERARALLEKARRDCNTPKVWMQSVQLEREHTDDPKRTKAHELVEEALQHHPTFAKLWMIGGQLYMEEDPPNLDMAADFFNRGLQVCTKAVPLWLCALDCQKRQGNWTKARALLEKARLKNPKSEDLWLAAVQIERAADNPKMAHHMMSRALQECPTSGTLWAEAIELEPKSAQNAKSVDALTKCENDANVIVAVARLFWRDGKIAKARKWFNRAVTLNPGLGNAWGAFLAFELENGTEEQQRDVINRCHQSEPNRGLAWNRIVKRVENWRLSIAEKLRKFVDEIYPDSLKVESITAIIHDALHGKLVLEAKQEPAPMEIENQPNGPAAAAPPSSDDPKNDTDPNAVNAQVSELLKSAKQEPQGTKRQQQQGGGANGVEAKKEPFVAAAKFEGPRAGYSFKRDEQGTGYYLDEQPTKRLKRE